MSNVQRLLELYLGFSCSFRKALDIERLKQDVKKERKSVCLMTRLHEIPR